jgi:hypothetical protein
LSELSELVGVLSSLLSLIACLVSLVLRHCRYRRLKIVFSNEKTFWKKNKCFCITLSSFDLCKCCFESSSW